MRADKELRVLVVASEVAPVRSGVARAVERIAAGVRGAGHDVVVRSYADAPSLIGDRVRLSTLAFRIGKAELRQFDLVHIHGPAPSLSDVLLLRRRLGSLPAPVVYTHHFTLAGDVPALAPLYRGYDAVARRLAGFADAVVVTTDAYAARLRTGQVDAVDVVPWGIDPPSRGVAPRLLRPSSQPLRVLVIGQLRRYKGHLVAADALAGVPGISLTLAGGGDLEPQIRAAAAEVANVDAVIDPSDAVVDRLYADHDIVLLPSTSEVEAFGIVLVEGMARGCVPVASDLPGVGDVVGDVGALVTPGDRDDLRRTLVALNADRVLLVELAARARERASLFTWDRTVEAYLGIYERVKGQRR